MWYLESYLLPLNTELIQPSPYNLSLISTSLSSKNSHHRKPKSTTNHLESEILQKSLLWLEGTVNGAAGKKKNLCSSPSLNWVTLLDQSRDRSCPQIAVCPFVSPFLGPRVGGKLFLLRLRLGCELLRLKREIKTMLAFLLVAYKADERVYCLDWLGFCYETYSWLGLELHCT